MRDWDAGVSASIRSGRSFAERQSGLGVELDEDVARAHPYTGPDLHLNPIYGELQEEHYP